MNVRKEMLEGPGIQQWHRGLRPETAATKQDGIQQALQGDPRAGDCEMSSRDFQRIQESEGLNIVEGSTPSKTVNETANRVEAGNVGALATLGSFVPLTGKSGMMVKNLDWLAPYQGATQDAQP
jgi:hypothetical protein